MNSFVHGSFVYGACLIAGNGNTVSRKVEKARFSYRHPERSRGIFFVGGKRASVRQREMGNTVSRKGGDGASPKRLSEGGGKRETKKISRCARNDSVGNGYLVHHAKKECVGNAFFPYRHPERSRGIFFVGGKRASVWQRETGNAVSRKDGRRCFL